MIPAASAQAPAPEEMIKPGPMTEAVQGKADAPITLIEYASMTCSHCANFDTQVYPTLKAKYIDTGKVRYIMREFPLDPQHALLHNGHKRGAVSLNVSDIRRCIAQAHWFGSGSLFV